MAHHHVRLTRITAAAALACAFVNPALAQSAGTVTITGRAAPNPNSLSGFGDTSLARLPMQASVYGLQQLADIGVQSVGGLTALDASIGDAYNAAGYWGIVAVRGYTLDNRFNYRRDGLPINAETAIGFDNKERVEILKGISGMQAGTSAPGGLVNLVTKRANGSVRSARLEAREAGSLLGAVDIGERLGADGRFGLRLNAAYEKLNPKLRDAQGERWLAALAADAQLSADTALQAEIEASHQRQASAAGFSMLGDTVPDAKQLDPRINLNSQPWNQPVVMDGITASMRLQQRLSADWSFTAHALQQRLKSDDRTAFPYGVYDANYECPQWCDRFAPDGTFTYWQYVSDKERRTSSALSLAVTGRTSTGGIEHDLEAGVLFTRYRGRFQDQIYDIAGTGRIDGTAVTPASFGGTDANINRDERSTEVFARDAMQLAPSWQLWAGLRRTSVHRESVRTSAASDGLRPTAYSQSFTAPWLGISHELAAGTIVYASWGQGLETDVAPNRARYTNRGQALPTLKSRQAELGLKHEAGALSANLALFDIERPVAVDLGACSAADTCTRQIDGSQRHRGIEGGGSWQAGRWTLQGSAMWLDPRRRGATSDPAANGRRPVNVPERTLRLGADYRLDKWPGLVLQARLSAESDRHVLPYDESARIPGWARVDLGARWRHQWDGTVLVWRLAVDNAADRRAWKESPYQFGHVYLYPMAPRTWRASVQATF
jgi:iron complex outermembrane recepter protein